MHIPPKAPSDDTESLPEDQPPLSVHPGTIGVK